MCLFPWSIDPSAARHLAERPYTSKNGMFVVEMLDVNLMDG